MRLNQKIDTHSGYFRRRLKSAGVVLLNVNVNVNLGGIRVGSMASDCGIFIGDNMQHGWDSHGKTNAGFGAVVGDGNQLLVWMSQLFDSDLIDVPIFDNDIKSPAMSYVQGG